MEIMRENLIPHCQDISADFCFSCACGTEGKEQVELIFLESQQMQQHHLLVSLLTVMFCSRAALLLLPGCWLIKTLIKWPG